MTQTDLQVPKHQDSSQIMFKNAIYLTLFAILAVMIAACILMEEYEPQTLDSPPICQPSSFSEVVGDWSATEIATICSLWIGSLSELPPDPSNLYGDDERAADFGHQLFFDTRLSADGDVACATCHLPELNFTDGLAVPIGGGARKTQTIVGTAYSPWFFWDGHKDSQWAQALEPLESPIEHGGVRKQYVDFLANDPDYRATYESIFGELPDLTIEENETAVFVNLGKAIAAYERTIMPAASRFDEYAVAVMTGDARGMRQQFSEDEAAGLELFINQGSCVDCHNGPLFTNNEFHGTNVFGTVDQGRLVGAELVVEDEFNCLSVWSDAAPEECVDLRFILTDSPELDAAFKTPTLRNVAEMAPYTHNGAFRDLAGILDHYNRGGLGSGLGIVGHNDLLPLNLSDEQLGQLEAFLRTLSGGVDAPEGYLSSP